MQSPIEHQYHRDHLFETIVQALEQAGIDKDKVTRNDLAMVDEFHVRAQEATMELALQAGLQPLTITDQSQQGILFLQKVLQHIAVKGMPKLGIQLLMGANAPEKLHNLYTNLVEDRIVLQSGICELLTIK